MSMQHFADVWANSPCTGGTLLVHLAMADMADIEGYVTAQQGQIGMLARVAVPTVQRAITQLIEASLIQAVTTPKRGATTTYKVNQVFPNDRSNYEALMVVGGDTYINDGQDTEKVLHDDVSPSDKGEESNVAPVSDIPSFLKPQVQPEVKDVQPVSTTLPPPATIPPVDFPAALQDTLKALKVGPADPPLYWYRAEHMEAFKALLYDLGATPLDLISAIVSHNIVMPDIRSLDELRPILKARGLM